MAAYIAPHHCHGCSFDKAQCDDTVRCVIVTGSETVFAVGANIAEMVTKDAQAVLVEERPHLFAINARISKPIANAVSGHALAMRQRTDHVRHYPNRWRIRSVQPAGKQLWNKARYRWRSAPIHHSHRGKEYLREEWRRSLPHFCLDRASRLYLLRIEISNIFNVIHQRGKPTSAMRYGPPLAVSANSQHLSQIHRRLPLPNLGVIRPDPSEKLGPRSGFPCPPELRLRVSRCASRIPSLPPASSASSSRFL